MTKTIYLTLFLALLTSVSFSQDDVIRIVDLEEKNRLYIYGINTSDEDLDVTITVEGMGFKQSARIPRATRIPAASKVQLQNLIIERGKRPFYTYKLIVSDSLSRRALRPPVFEHIKIDPRKPILIYLTENCNTCDTIVKRMDSSYYNYRKMILADSPELKETMKNAFQYTKTPYDSIRNPIVNIGGKLYADIESYERLIAILKEEEKEKEVQE